MSVRRPFAKIYTDVDFKKVKEEKGCIKISGIDELQSGIEDKINRQKIPY